MGLLTAEEKDKIIKKSQETNNFATVVASTVARLYRADGDPGENKKR